MLFDWLVSIEFAKETSKLIGHVTSLVPCMDSREEQFTPACSTFT